MPKFGLKCFIGSFLLSLVAIFATTKAYLVMSLNDERKSEPLTHITGQNIDLFASNEEDDPIYEKFNKIISLRITKKFFFCLLFILNLINF